MLFLFMLSSAAFGATLNVATLDSAVDLRDPTIARYVSRDRLAEIAYSRSTLLLATDNRPEKHGTKVARRLLAALDYPSARLAPLVQDIVCEARLVPFDNRASPR